MKEKIKKQYSMKHIMKILEGYNEILLDEIEELLIRTLRQFLDEMNKL